jgi:hypothetical protein
VGEAYLSVPQVGGGYTGNIGYCNSNTVQWVMPCVNTLPANAAQIIQSRDDVPDPHALNWRRLGFGLMGPGRQYEFSTAVPDPTGKWAVFACNWCDGVRNELFMAKLPKLPTQNQTQAQNDFQPVKVTVGPSAEMDQARGSIRICREWRSSQFLLHHAKGELFDNHEFVNTFRV